MVERDKEGKGFMRAIDADKFKEWMKIPEHMFNANADKYFTRAIDKQPTLDIKPVVHAHWISKKQEWQCSNCGKGYWSMNHWFKFCPECGARIDEVQK